MTRPGIYRHYKGGLYRVLATAENCTNGDPNDQLVVYIALSNGKVYAREQEEFHEWIKEDHLAGGACMVPRFIMVEES